MKVDTSFPQPPPVPIPNRSAEQQAEQTSARPVDRPHHDEAANNQQTRQTVPGLEARGEAAESRREVSERGETEQRQPAAASPQGSSLSSNPTQPAAKGELLDVIA
jgi:hypothetical protein